MTIFSRGSFSSVRSISRSARRRGDLKRSLFFEDLEPRNLMAAWVAQGPFSATNGQIENIANRPIVGSIHTVLAHPTDANILYVGATNGGVWRTSNATSASPSWTTNTDSQSSISIGALAFDRADPTSQTIWAGNGLYSSFGRAGGSRDGLLTSADGGTTWTRVNGGGVLTGKNISGIVANGNTIVVSVNTGTSTANSNLGIFRSINGGTTFTQVNNATASAGLPFGRSYDLVADPLDPTILYTSNALPPTVGDQGVFKSIDTGATWTRVSTPAMEALFVANTSNAELAAGRFGEVYVAIINSGVMAGLFRSPDGGLNWTAMDEPSTNENGTDVGLNPGGTKGPVEGTPDEIAGGQGSIHFSIVADPTNANIVYVGGDRQPRTFGDTGSFPNSIGANDFSGRLFRGDATQPAGSQFVHLTHRNNLGAVGGGTASSSSPHADSREMTIDANGNIIEVDDGGIYRRTSPRTNTGDWFSVIGNLQITEAHDVAYDNRSNVLITGNQDTGTTFQPTAGAAIWNSVSTADGGDVAVDELALAASSQSIRYSSFQNLGSFRRRVHNAGGGLVSTTFPALTVAGGGAALAPAFKTVVQTNAVAGSRLIIQGTNSTYESLDQGATITEVGPGLGGAQDAIAYGGKLNGVTNPDVLWVSSGANVYQRTVAGGPLTAAPVQPVTASIRDLAIDPDSYNSVALLVSNSIRWSTDAGSTWSNITGNLSALTTDFRSLAFVPGIVDTIIAGTARGIFATSLAQLGTWFAMGTGFPNVPVYELEYDATDNVLVAGTLGRGAWSMPDVTSEIDTTIPPYDFGDAPNSYLVTSASNGPRHARNGPTLGALRDGELDGNPTANALGDNTTGTNDEDGVSFFSSAVPGFPLRMNVSAPTGGFLNVWLDADLDGTFSASERLASDQLLVSGTTTQFLVVPAAATSGASFMRFRITDSAGQATTPTGTALNGEVEDYSINVLNAVTFDLSANTIAENASLGTPIGNLSIATTPSSAPYSYSVAAGPGGTDNFRFSIIGNQLRLNTVLDFETQSTFSIRVRAVGLSSFAVEKIFTINATNVADAVVAGRKIFYNRSISTVFGDGSGNPTNAIDPTKVALLPGQPTSNANYTNYSRGINGLIVDLSNPAGPIASDFLFETWNGISIDGFVPTTAIPTLTVIPAGGAAGSNRVKIEFPDNEIRNTWLRVTVLASPTTDLPVNDVFIFGNAVADMYAGNVGNPLEVRVNATDTSIVRQNQSIAMNSVGITSIHDVNKDGRVNATDTSIVRQNQLNPVIRFLDLPTVQLLLANVLSTPRIAAIESRLENNSLSTPSIDAYFEALGRKR